MVGTEDFRCAPGPMGWRYVSEIERHEPDSHREVVDVVVDVERRIVRARIETGSHSIRPRIAATPTLEGTLDCGRIKVPYGPSGASATSPPPWARAPPATRGTTEIHVGGPAAGGAGSSTRQRYVRPSQVRRDTGGPSTWPKWHYTALASGWESDLWVADDVVMRYDRAFELISYEAGATGPVGPVAPRPDYPVLTASTSSSRSTVLLTRSPPVSRDQVPAHVPVLARASVARADAGGSSSRRGPFPSPGTRPRA